MRISTIATLVATQGKAEPPVEACGVLWFAAAHIHDIDLHEVKDVKLMICVASFDLKQLLVWKFMEILSLVWIHLCVVLISVMICLSSPVGLFIH